MKKNFYEKPATKVVELQHRCQILAGSGNSTLGASRGGYGDANIETWEE